MPQFFQAKEKQPIARRTVSPAKAIAIRKKQYAYSQTLQGKIKKRISQFFAACAVCVTGAGTGIFAGHAGCVITPIVTALAPYGDEVINRLPLAPATVLGTSLAFNAATAAAWYATRNTTLTMRQQIGAVAATTVGLVATAATGTTMLVSAANYQPAMMWGISAGITAVTLGGWYELRGRHVASRVRNTTFAIAAASLVSMAAIKTPHMYDMWQTYKEMTDQSNGGNSRAQLIDNANKMGMTLDQYMEISCGSTSDPRQLARAKMSYWSKIRASFAL